MPKQPYEKYSDAEWEHLRECFRISALNDTEMAILGQNAGVSWPFKGSDETPTKYIEYSLEELHGVPGLIGKKKRIHNLMDILRETLAFDEPFADMADKVENESEIDDTFEVILAKLEIPLNFPAEFVHFSDETITLFKGENITTLIDIVRFAQGLVKDGSVNVELNLFLNGLANKDEPGIARHIPYRRAQGGVHLTEAIGLIATELPEPIQLDLLVRNGATLKADQAAIHAKMGGLEAQAIIKDAVAEVQKRLDWFKDEAADLENIFKTGGSPGRYFIPLNNPHVETVSVELIKPLYGASDLIQKKIFFGKFLGR